MSQGKAIDRPKIEVWFGCMVAGIAIALSQADSSAPKRDCISK